MGAREVAARTGAGGGNTGEIPRSPGGGCKILRPNWSAVLIGTRLTAAARGGNHVAMSPHPTFWPLSPLALGQPVLAGFPGGELANPEREHVPIPRNGFAPHAPNYREDRDLN